MQSHKTTIVSLHKYIRKVKRDNARLREALQAILKNPSGAAGIAELVLQGDKSSLACKLQEQTPLEWLKSLPESERKKYLEGSFEL